MKKTNLIKGILLIVLSVVLIGSNIVYAASTWDDNFNEIMGETETTDTDEPEEDDEPLNLTTPSSNTNTSDNTLAENNTNKASNNSSVYSNNTNTNTNTNSSLPKTGIEDSLPTMVLIVVFAISAVYAYKKISEYKNV